MLNDLVPGDKRTAVMGIINCTPDSFSDGGELQSADEAVEKALDFVKNGADIIDIGGESTRPGAKEVSTDQELERVIPVVAKVAELTDAVISIDTRKAVVAKEAVSTGARVINDISGLTYDPEMVNVALLSDAYVVVMHMLSGPETMQDDPQYDNVIEDIGSYLDGRIVELTSAGIKRERIIIDPGIGFGKTVEHNLTLINNLGWFKRYNSPVLIGVSRKAFIGKTLGVEVGDRLEGTAAAVAVSIARGADIVRVHDVKEMVRVAAMVDAIISES